ncbi:hypothetical protein Saa2_04507 [Streptomyces acidiscabies]|nr:hypothetical protein Saa2_04507 [Streptomyces acidiscabies]
MLEEDLSPPRLRQHATRSRDSLTSHPPFMTKSRHVRNRGETIHLSDQYTHNPRHPTPPYLACLPRRRETIRVTSDGTARLYDADEPTSVQKRLRPTRGSEVNLGSGAPPVLFSHRVGGSEPVNCEALRSRVQPTGCSPGEHPTPLSASPRARGAPWPTASRRERPPQPPRPGRGAAGRRATPCSAPSVRARGGSPANSPSPSTEQPTPARGRDGLPHAPTLGSARRARSDECRRAPPAWCPAGGTATAPPARHRPDGVAPHVNAAPLPGTGAVPGAGRPSGPEPPRNALASLGSSAERHHTPRPSPPHSPGHCLKMPRTRRRPTPQISPPYAPLRPPP